MHDYRSISHALTSTLPYSEHENAQVIGNDLSPIQPKWYSVFFFSPSSSLLYFRE